ncbi:hypothetical protein Trydic_g14311 [Trypoxylus dichotomus]
MASIKHNESFSRLVEEIRARLLGINDDSTALEPAIKECERHIRQMNAAIKASTTTGEKQHIINCVTLMQVFRSMMKSLQKVTGGSYKPTNSNCSNYVNGEIFEFKDLKTKNSPVYRDAEVDEGFGENVRDPSLTQLKEFQEKDSG